MKYLLTKREILKSAIIGIIVISVLVSVYVILPQYFDLKAEEMVYLGSPTYACTEPFEISSCLNKTNLHGYQFSNSGLAVRDINFRP